MAEQKTDKTYEDLMQEHIYGPLGMTNSGFGVLSPGPLDGPWQHGWDASSFAVIPDQNTQKPAASWHPRNPVGGACCSAEDMGKFLREQLRPDPQVFSTGTRATMQIQHLGPDVVRGGWFATVPNSATTEIAHNGDNGVSYAHVVVSLSQKIAYGAMSNVNSTFGAPAVTQMHEIMLSMHARWNDLFGDPSLQLWECAHPMPAFTFAGPDKVWLFARRHTGAVVRQRGTAGFGGFSWETPVLFPSAVFTSGLAAAASSDGQRIMVTARGTDNRIWRASSTDGGAVWQGWNPIGAGTFLTGPALTMSSDGIQLFACATGMDRKIYRSRSLNGGESWTNWEAIGQGVFTSAPAAAASGDHGQIVHVFGRGTDHRIWRNRSTDTGFDWQAHWKPIGNGVFTSSPAAAVSTDGAKVHVLGRGTDRGLWRNSSVNSGDAWLPNWEAVPSGTFTSAPTLDGTGDGNHLFAFAIGTDFRIYKNHFDVAGKDWDGWQQVGSDLYL